MSKELFMKAHEELIEEYMAEHPEADWSEAYERTSDAAACSSASGSMRWWSPRTLSACHWTKASSGFSPGGLDDLNDLAISIGGPGGVRP
jgi:hypothetical protein